MAIGKVILAHFGESLPIEEDEFEYLQNRIDDDVKSVGGRLGYWLNSPYLLLILPFVLPLIVQLYDWAVQRFVPQPEPDDAENAEFDAALELILTHLKNKKQ